VKFWAGNAIYWVYVSSLPVGPIWFLHAFSTVSALLMRLFILSVCAWLLGRISHAPARLPSRGVMWGAVIISALVFAGGHLPATSLTVAITPLVVVRALVLNGMLGLLYGYLYWRRGLEAAMLGHFSSDVVLHFLLPLLG
jgi:hypothetical protein